jgi:hypothetical protein
MNVLKLIVAVLIPILLGCSNQKPKQEKTQEIVTDTHQTPSGEESTNPMTIREDGNEDQFIVRFYNNVLAKMYPLRDLTVRHEQNNIPSDPSCAEDVEGGGLSRNYLTVLEDTFDEIGVIIYNLDTEYNKLADPFLLSMAILEPGNTLVSAGLTGDSGYTTLKISSNKSGKLSLGPYDYGYYTYNMPFVGRQPIYEIHGIEDEPQLTMIERENIIEKLSIRIYGTYSGLLCEDLDLEGCAERTFVMTLIGNGMMEISMKDQYNATLLWFMESRDSITFLPIDYFTYEGNELRIEESDLESTTVPVVFSSYEAEVDNIIHFKKGSGFIPKGKLVRED